ncbi:MAG: SHOCT domain-containing protein [Acutalibacteraceae bacterium]
MKEYCLNPDESVLYECDECRGVKIILTNLNLVIIKKTIKLFSKNQANVDVYPKESIKIYNDLPQVKQKDCMVEIYFVSDERKIEFYSRNEAKKFVKVLFELLTGKATYVRRVDKVKNVVGVVDDTLGIDTVDTVVNVIKNGVTSSAVGIIGKKIPKSSKASGLIKNILNESDNILDSSYTATKKLDGSEIDTSMSNEKIETLKNLKNLLDSGVLTQEEFDAKKKEILGL